jgi:hypothetical protein
LNVSPANCDTATATVVVNNPVDASERSIGNCCIKQYGSNGIERIENDTLSNIAATTTNTNVTPLTTGPLSIDANGIVTVAANTKWYVQHHLPIVKPINRIKCNPANCDNATATVVNQ